MLVEYVTLHHVDQATGSLVVAEGEGAVPFAIRRIYFVHQVPPTVTRGGHAHRKTVQLAICVSGRCRFRLDDGRERDELVLSDPNKGLLLRPFVWHDMMEFSQDCVLLVLASEHYDEADYIRDYEEFTHAIAAR